jgi:hypothetical protein
MCVRVRVFVCTFSERPDLAGRATRPDVRDVRPRPGRKQKIWAPPSRPAWGSVRRPAAFGLSRRAASHGGLVAVLNGRSWEAAPPRRGIQRARGGVRRPGGV